MTRPTMQHLGDLMKVTARRLFASVALLFAALGCASAANDVSMHIKRLDPALDALIAPDAQIERVATGFKFTEGPMWRQGRLWFSDLQNDKVLAVTPEGKVETLIE